MHSLVIRTDSYRTLPGVPLRTSGAWIEPQHRGDCSCFWASPPNASRSVETDPAETRYGAAVDVKRAAELYAQGRTLRQIGAELGVTATTVSHQLRRAGVTMRRGGASAHPASTQQILELRDQGLTWPEIAEQVDMTVSGAWSRYRRARPPKSPRLGRWQQVLADALTRTLRLASEQPSLIISVERPPGLS